jgi:hypothetical protein
VTTRRIHSGSLEAMIKIIKIFKTSVVWETSPFFSSSSFFFNKILVLPLKNKEIAAWMCMMTQ